MPTPTSTPTKDNQHSENLWIMAASLTADVAQTWVATPAIPIALVGRVGLTASQIQMTQWMVMQTIGKQRIPCYLAQNNTVY